MVPHQYACLVSLNISDVSRQPTPCFFYFSSEKCKRPSYKRIPLFTEDGYHILVYDKELPPSIEIAEISGWKYRIDTPSAVFFISAGSISSNQSSTLDHNYQTLSELDDGYSEKTSSSYATSYSGSSEPPQYSSPNVETAEQSAAITNSKYNY